MGSYPPRERPSVASAVVATVVALTALNVALAYLIAGVFGARAVALSDGVVWLLFGLALACGIAAVVLWRRYARGLAPGG